MGLIRSSCAVLACDVFQEELGALVGGFESWGAVEFLEMGLHDQPDILRREVQTTVNRLEANLKLKTILLFYGVCGNGLIGIQSSRCRLVLPRAHDCVSILLGDLKVHEAILKENPGTYFYSPGWVRGRRVPGPDRDKRLREYYGDKYPDDQELVDDLIEADRETYAHHNCASYVDVTANREAESYCKDCAVSLGWEYRRLKGNPALLKDLLSGNWDSSRFLVTEPGAPIADVLEGPAKGIQA